MGRPEYRWIRLFQSPQTERTDPKTKRPVLRIGFDYSSKTIIVLDGTPMSWIEEKSKHIKGWRSWGIVTSSPPPEESSVQHIGEIKEVDETTYYPIGFKK